MSSWFNAASFSTLAKTAFNSAQKQIDKVLDIREQEEAANREKAKEAESVPSEPVVSSPHSATKPKKVEDDQFWATWLESSSSSSSSPSGSKSAVKATTVEQPIPTPSKASFSSSGSRAAAAAAAVHEVAEEPARPSLSRTSSSSSSSSGFKFVPKSSRSAEGTAPAASGAAASTSPEFKSGSIVSLHVAATENPAAATSKSSSLSSSDSKFGAEAYLQQGNVEDACPSSSRGSSSVSSVSPSPPTSKKDLSATSQYAVMDISSSSASPAETNEATTGSPSDSTFIADYVNLTSEEAQEEIALSKEDEQQASSTRKGIDLLNSGHNSSDERDTCTSSDIEVISLPSNCGEPADWRLSSPSRQVASMGLMSGHHRNLSSESFKTSSLSEPEDDREQNVAGAFPQYVTESLSEDELQPSPEPEPELVHVADPVNEGGSRLSVSDADSLASDCTLVREDSNDNMNHPLHPSKLLQKLSDMAQKLEAREQALMRMSQENAELRDQCGVLSGRIQMMEETQSHWEEVKNELHDAAADFEVRLQSAVKERDTYRRQLETFHSKFEESSQLSDAAHALLQEKEEQIRQLMEEGEKLSRTQLQHTTIIKKLRSKEKETDELNESQKKKIDKMEKEIEEMRATLEGKEKIQLEQSDTIRKLEKVVVSLEKELNQAKSDLEDAQEKARSMKVALENSYREIGELHKARAAQDSQIREVSGETSERVKEEVRRALEREQQAARHRQEALVLQLEDARALLGKQEMQVEHRENQLRLEIATLQQRLQAAEARNEELTQSVSAVTRPLVRQIESLQATHLAQTDAWEKLEKSLTDRLAKVQSSLDLSDANERVLKERCSELERKSIQLEAMFQQVKQERIQLVTQLEIANAQLELLRDERTREAAQLEAVKYSLQQQNEHVRSENEAVTKQIEFERVRFEMEAKKAEQLRQTVLELETRMRIKDVATAVAITSPTSVPTMSRSMTVSGQDSDSEYSWNRAPSVYEALRASAGTAHLLESLQEQVRRKEGEVTQLQADIAQLERSREAIATELVHLSETNSSLEKELDALRDVKERHEALEQKYNLMMQLYGEKEEEAEELRMDLADLKEMYRTQLNQLLLNQTDDEDTA